MKILIVEDEPVSRKLLGKTLETMGHEIIAAENGLKAWGIIKRSKISAVITDWMMPNMDGLSLCRKIRSSFKEKYVYIIVLTAKDHKQDLIEVFESGADDYINKPFDPAELKARIKTAERIIQLEKGHRRAQHILLKRTQDLGKRVKELNCLYGVSDFIEKHGMPLEKILQGTVDLIPPSLQYPETTCARLTFEDKIFITGKFNESAWKQACDIIVHGEKIGKLEVFYLEERPGMDEGPFIKEERNLINEIAERLGHMQERIKADNDFKLFRKLVNQVNDSIFLVDPVSGKFLDVNSKACESLGYHRKELTNMKVMDIRKDYPDDDTWVIHIQKLREKGSELIYGHHKRKNGSIFPVEASIKYVVQDKKEYLVTTARDISERKKAEKERRMIESQLLQSEKMASIGQLAAGVAHEINNPTGFVSSNLRTLSEYLKDISDLTREYSKFVKDVKEIATEHRGMPVDLKQLEHITALEEEVDIYFILNDISDLINESREGTERIKKIVQDLKDFAHPGEDKPKFADINRNLDSTLNVVSNELKYKAKVFKDYGELPEVKCYPQLLNQVFVNVLVNAAQAIEKKGEIKIGTRANNGNVQVTISDTGKGIPKENLTKIFDPFFTTKEVGSGTGLGMNVAYNIIKKHNGTIDVESIVGTGTTFTIRIPTTDERHE